MKQKKRERYAKSLCLHAVAAAVLLLRLCIDLDATAENSSACTERCRHCHVLDIIMFSCCSASCEVPASWRFWCPLVTTRIRIGISIRTEDPNQDPDRDPDRDPEWDPHWDPDWRPD
jgi:hypothetical protein